MYTKISTSLTALVARQLYPLISQHRLDVQRIAYRILSKIIKFNTSELVVEMAAAIGEEDSSKAPTLSTELMHQVVQPMTENQVRGMPFVCCDLCL